MDLRRCSGQVCGSAGAPSSVLNVRAFLVADFCAGRVRGSAGQWVRPWVPGSVGFWVCGSGPGPRVRGSVGPGPWFQVLGSRSVGPLVRGLMGLRVRGSVGVQVRRWSECSVFIHSLNTLC